MAKLWMVLDMSYLGYRALYSTGSLSNGIDSTGAIYGILRDVESLGDRFCPDHFVFCFDRGPYWREEESKSYKEARRQKKLLMLPAEKKAAEALKSQLKKLRREYLPHIGYKNVFSEPGAEADDIIASVVKNKEPQDTVVIVTGDKDLYQLLSLTVHVYFPRTRELVTHRKFFNEYGIYPPKWATVKAMAGCHSDSVKGIKGVGEHTAVKFITGSMSRKSKTWRKIMSSESNNIVNRNLQLVDLPHPRTSHFVPVADEVDVAARKKVMRELNIRSLRT